LSNVNNLDKFLPEHPVMFSAFKPKAEIYAVKDYRTKTRNIVALSVIAQKVIQPVHNAYFGNKPAFDFDDFKSYPRGQMPAVGTNINLQGHNYADGNMSRLLNRVCRSKEGDVGIHFMSDNLFVFGRQQ
jgi:hypothetical protein